MNACKHIALRWSAKPLRMSCYKHRAPLEHFAANHQSNLFSDKPVRPYLVGPHLQEVTASQYGLTPPSDTHVSTILFG